MYTTDAVPNGCVTLTGKPRMEKLQLKGMSESLEIKTLELFNILSSFLHLIIVFCRVFWRNRDNRFYTHTKDRKLKA